MFICHSNEGGNFRGENEYANEVAVIVEVENGLTNSKGRFGGSELQIMQYEVGLQSVRIWKYRKILFPLFFLEIRGDGVYLKHQFVKGRKKTKMG